MNREFAYLTIEQTAPQNGMLHHGHRVAKVLTFILETREKRARKTLATFSPLYFVSASKKERATLLPEDRARTWEELAKWIEFLVIFPEPTVQTKQYENRLKLEGAQFSLRPQPTEQELYDWRIDEPLLRKLRPRYATITEKMIETIGRPHKADFSLLYPNPYDDEDEGLSDQARWALRSLKAVFGKEILER
jgi:hypothetical protein